MAYLAQVRQSPPASKNFLRIFSCPFCRERPIFTDFRPQSGSIRHGSPRFFSKVDVVKKSFATIYVATSAKTLPRWIFCFTIPACSSDHATKNRTAKSSLTGHWWNRTEPPKVPANASSLISVSWKTPPGAAQMGIALWFGVRCYRRQEIESWKGIHPHRHARIHPQIDANLRSFFVMFLKSSACIGVYLRIISPHNPIAR